MVEGGVVGIPVSIAASSYVITNYIAERLVGSDMYNFIKINPMENERI